MADCIYVLNGKMFNSELELDNFILNNRICFDNLDISDIVFNLNTAQNNICSFLQTKKNEAEHISSLRALYEKVKQGKGFITMEDERLVAPYMGVNKALQEFTNELGQHFVKKFIEENLQLKLYDDWENVGLKQNYAELIGDPEGTRYTSQDQKDIAWDKLKNAWKKLGESGTNVHKILLLAWDGKDADQIRNELGGRVTSEVIGLVFTIKNAIQGWIELKLGPGCEFFAEFPIIADTTWGPNNQEPTKLLGVIDLLVIDANGKPHVFDYKCSNKEYNDWSTSKLYAFEYQLATYKMALEAYGLDTSGSILGIIPINLDGFDGNTGNISGVSQGYLTVVDDHYTLKLYPESMIMTNLTNIIVLNRLRTLVSNNFVHNTNEQMHKIFPSYRFLQEIDEAIMADLERDLQYNDSTGKWELINKKPYGKNEFDSVEEYYNYLNDRNEDSFKYYYSLLKRAIQQADPSILSQEESKSYLQGTSREWFQSQFEQYCTGNGEWLMVEVPEFEAMGIIMMHNLRGKYYKVYVIDNNNPRINVKFKKGKSILGSFVDDISPEQEGVIPLEGTIGNINNIKAMIALNNFPDVINPGETIEGIYPICPRALLGSHASAKQLTDNFRILAYHAGILNNFDSGKLRFLPAYLAAFLLIREYGIQLTQSGKLNKIYSLYETGALKQEENLKALLAIKLALEDAYPDLTNFEKNRLKADLSTPQGKAYGKICLAIAEILNGYYTQELRDGSRIKHLIDNPEIMEHNIRNIYKITTNFHEAYRRRMNKLAEELRTVMDKFWKAKGYSLARRNMLNDERVLYENMIDRRFESKSGVYRFKNPWDNSNDLTEPEREFLKWHLDKLAKLRNPNLTDAELVVERGNSTYLDIPLLRRTGSKNPFTANGRKGLVSWFKKSLDYFKNFSSNIKSGISGALSGKDVTEFERNTKSAFEIFDVFEASDNEVKRELLLRETDLDVFDDDIGNIFYMYSGAKLRKQVLDEYMPLLQAQLIQNMFEASTNNIDIPNNVKYILEYTKAKILDMSIVPENYRGLAKALEKIRSVTTYATLGFSPKSGLFLMMEGVWKNASRAGFKPLGENQFGKEELMKAVKWVMGDTPDHFKVVSMGELLNEWYGINDMDIRSLAQRLREGLYPLSLASKAMWLTSAPDYFNRMSIFIAQMIKDGCFDAHEKVDMGLRYNWKKDKRFSAFANGDRSDMVKYNKQKALYHTMMALFIKEGYQIEDENGNLRDLQYDPTSDVPQDDLPQAYTNLEARNIKSFADLLYGYYNHEDLFMLKSMLLGSQFTLFRTYWSSLKNRWFLRGGVYSNGGWQLAKDSEGNPMFKKITVDENGNILNVEITDEDTGEPYMIWKGSYLEGIAITLKECLLALFDPDSELPLKERAIRIIHGDTGVENEDVIKARVTNLKLFAHDMIIWLLLGVIFGSLITKYLKDQAKADKNKKLSFGDMTLRSVEGIFASSLISSVLDLGAIKDLASPLTDWNPPSFRVLNNIWEDGAKVITGDKDFTKAVVENISVLRQTRNYWYSAALSIQEAL